MGNAGGFQLEIEDLAGRAARKQHALQRKRIGVGPKAAAAIAEMPSDIKAGPVVDGLQRRRLEREIGGERRAAEPEPESCGCRDPRAAAVRDMKFPQRRHCDLSVIAGHSQLEEDRPKYRFDRIAE